MGIATPVRVVPWRSEVPRGWRSTRLQRRRSCDALRCGGSPSTAGAMWRPSDAAGGDGGGVGVGEGVQHGESVCSGKHQENHPVENGESNDGSVPSEQTSDSIPRPSQSSPSKEARTGANVAFGAGIGDGGAAAVAQEEAGAAAALKVNVAAAVEAEEERKKEERKAKKRQKKAEDGERVPKKEEELEATTNVAGGEKTLAPSNAQPASGSVGGEGAGAGGGGGGGSDGGGTRGDSAATSEKRSANEVSPTSAGMTTSGKDSAPRTPTSPKDPAAPPALNKVLEQLGLIPQSRLTGEAAAAAELESKFRAVALAARADAQTLPLRLERQARLREQSERNVTAEADELARALHRLNYLCKEAESVELLGAAREQIQFVLRAAKYVAATAETMGALRLEARMSGWMEASLRYNDQLKLQLETARTEQEEMRRMLSESGAAIESGSPASAVRRSLLSAKLGSQRRASIAAPPRIAASSSNSTNTKDQGRLSLAFVPGSSSATPPLLRLGTGRRPLSSASSDTAVGGTGIECVTPSPPIVPDDFVPRMDETTVAPMDDDIVDSGSNDETLPLSTLPRLSVARISDPEVEVLSVPLVRRRESAAITSIATVAPPRITVMHSARSLYQSTAISDLFEYIWPPDLFVCAQHARWLLVRLLVLAAVWCLVQAFMSPADAYEQYSPDTADFEEKFLQFVGRPD